MKAKSLCLFVFVFSLPFATWSFGFEDCFNYQCTRQDLEKGYGWDVIKAFEEKGEYNFMIEKRWPTVNLKLTHEQERARFGTTGLEQAQRDYLIRHFDGTTMRMLVYINIEHAAGERKILGWRTELNPPMPREYLDPNYPEQKKKGRDWSMVLHWVEPSDIRGTGILIHSYNNKARDQDTWIWFPSLRKVRRLTPVSGSDALVGSDLSFGIGLLMRITDEKHQIIGETMVAGFRPVDYYENLYLVDKYGPGREYVEYYKKNVNQPRECWVIRSKSVKGGYGDWFDTRVRCIDKEWGCAYTWGELYDPRGRMFKTSTAPYVRMSDYNGKPRFTWCVTAGEFLNFEDRGFSYYIAPQTQFGCPVPESWFTLRELQRSVPTVLIPYMVVLPPKKLAPLEDLYPPEAIEARKEFFPERITSFPNPTGLIGYDKWK